MGSKDVNDRPIIETPLEQARRRAREKRVLNPDASSDWHPRMKDAWNEIYSPHKKTIDQVTDAAKEVIDGYGGAKAIIGMGGKRRGGKGQGGPS